MSRLTSIFRRRGDEPEPGQETEGQPAAAGTPDPAPDTPGFRDRGKLRRRLHYLRRVRELQLRDLGGLVFETYRLARPRQDLVDRKVQVLATTDAEVAGLEAALDDHQSVRELREPGIGGQCPRCGEIFGSDASFCWNCGAGLTGEAARALGQFGGAAAIPGQGTVAPPAGVPAQGAAPALGAAPGPLTAAAPGQAAMAPPVQDLSSQAHPPGAAAAGAAASGPRADPASHGTDPASPATGTPAFDPASPGSSPVPAFDPASPPPSGPAHPGAAPVPNPAAASAAPVPNPAAGAAPPTTPQPPASPGPAAPPPSGGQGVASGDPLGQSAPKPDGDEAPSPGLQSGDPLGAKPPATDETVVLPPPASNGSDEADAAKARSAKSPDDSE